MKRNILLLGFLILTGYILAAQSFPGIEKDSLEANFKNPPADCWPHTRWWWPGNPVSKEEITYELEEMRSHGIRGVEQITMGPVYEKGNIPYLSDQFMEMLKHTIKEAKRLGMEVSLNFGGPGWIIGGEWVNEEDKSKDMVPTFLDLKGNQIYNGNLPDELTKTKRSWEHFTPKLDGNETLLAVIAGRIERDGKINEKSLVNLTGNVTGNRISWKVSEGEWRLMAFWLKKNGISNAVDHFSKRAMEGYCEYLGNKFYSAFGDEFGKTVESLFADSFELANLSSGINWSTGLLEEFKNEKGYDLTTYLPAIWWEVSNISPKIRYDVNEFLHKTGLNVFFKTFLEWCESHYIQGRIQTYGFNTDNIEASGMTHIPEMEITAGEKDAADWFDTRIGPKKYVASGAHIYGRKIVSAEVYTFIHWERYRETLEELKIASDGYLLSGATKFYNHGFNFSPEKIVSPTRSLPFAAYIQPQNVWWSYYPRLAEYIARCSYLLRQGDFAPDIALYSPLANQWALNVLNPRKWTREFEWGELGNLLISNGYDYDLINDDALQNMAKIEDGKIKIQNIEYKLLILPNVETIPLKTLQFIEKYVDMGGVVIALERLPESSTGFIDYKQTDAKVKELTKNLFNKPKLTAGKTDNPYGLNEPKIGEGVIMNPYGKGRSYQLKNVIDRQIWWDKRSSTLDPFLETIRKHIAPDFGIDFAFEGIRKNEGLAFIHRKLAEKDIYFVSNIQDKQSAIPVTFRVKNKVIRKWNPYTGEITPILSFSESKDGIAVPLILAPYESMFVEFSPGEPETYVTKTDFYQITEAKKNEIKAYALQNGTYFTSIKSHNGEKKITSVVSGIPAPYLISGKWKIELKGNEFPLFVKQSDFLYSWTDDPLTRNFSGTGRYEINFKLSSDYIKKELKLFLDVGKVGNIAEVSLNDKNVGTAWMRDQKLDVTEVVKEGDNKLVILVTNTLINRVSAIKEPPPIPEDIVSRFGNGAINSEIPREFGFKPLPASGLMGPVQIVPVKVVTANF
ncbi:MAG: glycosyl hydrolase [Bacteroidales bacterium]|nr:glycosyl hydrolase [Bacteroidales bacterium]